MSTDTMSNTSVLRSDRRTVTQLLAAAEKDTDAAGLQPAAAVGGAVMRTCEDGCNGCDECTDYYCGDEYGDEPHGPPEYGCCLPPGECCMPGLHFPSECHTAADYERQHGVDWREPPNVGANRAAEGGPVERPVVPLHPKRGDL